MDKYIPPYEITDEMLDLATQIMEKLGQLNSVNGLEKLPKLRRVSRIKSIQSSLAIENNTLSIEQVTNVLNGKRVLGSQEDILAVKNASEAYKMLEKVDPYSINYLLRVHGLMMQGLVTQAGQLRSGQVGVYRDREVIHIAPSADRVQSLLESLFEWAKTSKVNMLIKSSIFHYEFEFIHPFADGNGRMGRLWHTALLASWKPIFAWIPIESIIKDNQQDYYRAIEISTSQGNSNAFIVFMLGAIDKAIEGIVRDTTNHLSHTSNYVLHLMEVIDTYPQSASQLMQKLNLKSRVNFRNNYLAPAIDAGLVGMTLPDKPTSKNQRYFKI